MGTLKIGVMIESFRLGVKKGIEKAAEIGADGFQIHVTSGEMAPQNLPKSSRKDFRRFVDSLGLEISALCGDFGHGFTDENKNEELIEKTKAVVDLAVDLGVSVITTHIGVIPQDRSAKEWKVMAEALEEIGNYAESYERYLATETGPEDTKLMAQFLDSLETRAVKVNYDPANLVMKGFDPLAGVWDLRDYIVHTHAKDGIRLPDGTPKEVPLGEGEVPFDEYIAALKEIGYNGFYTIEREVGDDPVSDIIKAKRFLEKY